VKIIKTHYEKISLLLVIIALLIGFIFSMFQTFETKRSLKSQTLPSFSISSFEGEKTLELLRETDLLPNDNVFFYNNNTGEVVTMQVTKAIFPRKSRVTILLNSQKRVKGRLLNPSSTVLSDTWKKARMPLSIDTDSGVLNLNMRDIVKIKGNQALVLNSNIEKLDPNEFTATVYQEKSSILVDSNRTEKVRWTSNYTDTNASIYDLFTPPIIYIVNGELTTSLPEKPKEEEKEEEFGLSLDLFEKEKFRLKLSSWIGKTPYFEDLLTKISPNSNINVKNRIEVKIPYKINDNYRPGLPSLLQTNLEDDQKFFMVEYFAVQEIKDSKTGGSKLVGRALVKDFTANGESFEINSLMSEVYSGKYKILLKFEMEGELPQEFLIAKEDIGKTFEFGIRMYKIDNIDFDLKTVEVSKKIQGKEAILPLTLSL
jgi:hypothetical protein